MDCTCHWKHPHERGEDWNQQDKTPDGFRNTPTSVGKTTTTCATRRLCKKHPHERGEDFKDAVEAKSRKETPPRAWGRPQEGHSNESFRRNTPTSVGKTSPNLLRIPCRLETPPRAWGRLEMSHDGSGLVGNTPTSVGKTIFFSVPCLVTGKHPHERGEDSRVRRSASFRTETPPRAWGRPLVVRP